MADENTPATPQAGAADPINPQGQVPTTPPTDPQAGESQPKPPKSAEDYERMIADLRKEAASHRVARKVLEDEKKAREEAELSEKQRLEKRLAEAQARESEATLASQERLIDAEIRYQMALQGIKSPRAARLIERERLEFDDRGNPKNVADLIKEILTELPDLGPRPSTPAPTAPTGGGPTSPPRSHAESGEVTASYVNDVMAGRIKWQELSQERRSAVLAWQAKNAFRF